MRGMANCVEMSTTFHVCLVIKIRHLPAVFLIVIVMCVSWVMRRSDGLCIRRRCPVIEVNLRSVLVGRMLQNLLRLLLSRRSEIKKYALIQEKTIKQSISDKNENWINHWPCANHPDKKNNEYYENDATSDASCYISELRLLGTMASCEGTDAATRRLSFHVLHADAFVLTILITNICNKKRFMKQVCSSEEYFWSWSVFLLP